MAVGVGRPTLYSEEKLALAKEYLESYEELGDAVPQVAGLACHMKIARDTVYDWISHEDKADFSDIVAQCLSSQERKLINGSLLGDLNPTISKLLLAKHGHSERIDNTLSGPNGNPIEVDQQWTVEFVNALPEG